MKRSLLTVPVAALLVVALSVAATAAPKPGKKPGQGANTLTIAAKPSTLVFGGASIISGRLTGPNNAGKTVMLHADAYPFNVGDAVVGKTQTAASGAYSFAQRPDRNTNFQATFGAVRSGPARVNVRFRLSLSVSDSTPRAGQLVRFRGRACPKSNGSVVSIQRKTSSGRFRTVGRTRLKAATTCSAYGRALRVRRPGTYRATTDDAAHARGYSRARFVNTH